MGSKADEKEYCTVYSSFWWNVTVMGYKKTDVIRVAKTDVWDRRHEIGLEKRKKYYHICRKTRRAKTDLVWEMF